MPVPLFIQGIIIGVVVAVPVGPLGLLCINRALAGGALSGLISGLGVATADAFAAAIAALGITLVSGFLIEHQTLLRLVGGVFLCYLGYRIYRAEPGGEIPASNMSGLLSAYMTTFFLTFSNPVTILSFVAIYAGLGVESLSGHYIGAAIFALGVFAGSALWWIVLFIGVEFFRDAFSVGHLRWVHRISGVLIAGFGVVVLLSLSPLRGALGFRF